VAKSKFEALDDGKVRLTATVDVATVDAVIAKIYRDAAKKYKFPGFRPGKAPRSVVEKAVGTEYAGVMATDEVINASFPQLIDEAGYRVIGRPSFDEEAFIEEGQDFVYTVEFEVRPVCTLKSTKVKATMPPREATDTEVDAQVDTIRGRFAQLKKTKSRTIKDDDFVLLSFTSMIDGEPYEGSEVENYPYQLGKNMMPPEFEEAIVGAKPGDTVETEFVLEDSGENTEFAGKTITFSITLHEIQAPELPEVNDDLAQMSGFENVEEMRAEIKKSIDDKKAGSYDNVLRQRLASALGEQLKGDIPEVLIEARANTLKRELAQMLQQNDMTLEQYIAATGTAPEEFEKDVITQAEMALSEELALEALARAEKLEPSDKDIAKEFEKMAKESDVTAAQMQERFEEAALMTTLRDDLARRNAVEWLVEHAEIEIAEEAI